MSKLPSKTESLPSFMDVIPIEFSDGETYTRKSTDNERLSKLEDMFKEIPKD